ncbi:hypothetical protein NM208_g16888 [Fusarium decemcellulare]|uniref:Uncharacterized protein n=1 Tax=Fusarium decemcellulare TaxID=57161 RepID=A0ACC1R908_9HYPO|nr:hypothetical protein NM208_g16888 [Fusarium decemcellulare]
MSTPRRDWSACLAMKIPRISCRAQLDTATACKNCTQGEECVKKRRGRKKEWEKSKCRLAGEMRADEENESQQRRKCRGDVGGGGARRRKELMPGQARQGEARQASKQVQVESVQCQCAQCGYQGRTRAIGMAGAPKSPTDDGRAGTVYLGSCTWVFPGPDGKGAVKRSFLRAAMLDGQERGPSKQAWQELPSPDDKHTGMD